MSKRKRYSRAVEQAIYDKAQHRCRICGRKIEFRDGTLDHIIPLKKGGPEHPSNLQWACWSCNNLKNQRWTDKEVREMLGLPKDYSELLNYLEQQKKMISPQLKPIAQKTPKLKIKGLNISEIEKNIKLIHNTYQENTIIPEIFKTSVSEPNLDGFMNVGISHRYPIDWFLPDYGEDIINDPVFTMIGRMIAFGEQHYLNNIIKNSFEEKSFNAIDSGKEFQVIIEKMQNRGVTPDVIWPTIPLFTKLHRWSEIKVSYPPSLHNNRIKAILKYEDLKLKVIPPLGDVPSMSLLLDSNQIRWRVKSYDEFGALFIAIGKDRLYPNKYSECIAFTSINPEINMNGIEIIQGK